MSSHSAFQTFLDHVFCQIKVLFVAKNSSYGAHNDLFWNFRCTAVRVFGAGTLENMYCGRELDIFMHCVQRAIEFGRQKVKVFILEGGHDVKAQ